MVSLHRKLVAAFAIGVFSLASHAADIELYPSGPAEDAAFLRFVDGGGDGLRVVATGSGGALDLPAGTRASPYISVGGGSEIGGNVTLNSLTRPVSLEALPGEFVTVLAIPEGDDLKLEMLHDKADDFSAVRASIAFYNLNSLCVDAAVQVAGRQAMLFERVAAREWVRRQVNPVPLAVQLMCGGQAVGPTVELGALQAGDRHSLFLIPGDPAKGFFHVKDAVAD